MKNKILIYPILIATIASCDSQDKGLTAAGNEKVNPTVTTTMADTLFKNGQRQVVNMPMQQATVQNSNGTVTQVPANGTIQQQLTPEQMTAMQHQFAQKQKPVVPAGYKGPLNPEHGKPGHRCELAVGAPLVGAQPVQTQTVQQIKPTIATSQPVAQKTAPGMNPPHGQPGHRCDIAVGQPLNSKPVTAANGKVQLHPDAATIVPNPANLKLDTSRKQ